MLMITGCVEHVYINDPETKYGSGKIISETRNVDECYGVCLKYAGKIFLTQGDEQSIRIEADDNIIDDVVAQSENGILNVGLKEGSYSNATVRIYVVLKNIKSISIEGAGNIVVENPITCSDLICNINGAGDIDLWGNGNTLSCRINGAGNISAFDFPAKYCTAKISGTGNCTVNVSENLDASISGVGNITYDGNPKSVKSSISGIGKINKR